MARIYMDHHATTPLDRRVFEAMVPFFLEKFGNAASRNHSFGWEAEKAVEAAREHLAALIGASPSEIIFTSGATEADNLAIRGVLESYREKGNHLITVATEHKAVLDTCKALEREGRASVTVLGVDSDGLVRLDELKAAITEKTVLVSVMHANNEIGVIQPVSEIGSICRERGVLFHSDATQAVGKIPVNVESMRIDLLSMSAHKMYGPKGVGALYLRKKGPRVRLKPLFEGGGHERGFRSGTLPVPLIVGFGCAAGIASLEMKKEGVALRTLRDQLEHGLTKQLDEVYLNGHRERRLPGNLSVSFRYVESESLIMGMGDVAVSSGSACTSASIEPSHVLRALGRPDDLAHGTIRFGLGRWNTEAEIHTVVEIAVAVVRRLRKMSPGYASGKGM